MVRERQNNKQLKIALFRALQLGDMLCTIPSFRAIRAAYPKAHITLIGLAWAEELVERFPHYFDAFIPFPGYPGLPETSPLFEQIPPFLKQVQQAHFDQVIQLHGRGDITNPLVTMFNASQTFGYYKPGNYCPDPQHFFPYPENQHEVLKWLQLLDRIGIPSQGSELEFPVSESDTKEFEALATHSSLAHLRYICIHPGARDIKRRWSAKEFAIVADALASYGYSIILTGTHEEREVTTAVISQMKSAVCDLTGKTTLGILAAVVQNATLVIANDTGISHLASALKTPSVIIIPTSHLSTWAPLDTQLHMSLPLESATAKIVISKAKAMLASRNQHTEESSRSRKLVL